MTQGGVPGVDELLELVIADPPRAAAAATSRLATGGRLTAREVARLHWVIGRAEREAGRLDSAKAHLEDALGIAGTIGDVEALIGIHSSLAFTVARQGDLDGALKLIDLAELMAGPRERARLMAQRGTVLYLRGELSRGAELVAAACEEMKRTGDTVHEARHRTNLGMTLSDLGRYRAARRHLTRAVSLAEQHGLDILVAHAKASLAYTSTLQGDLPAALREFGEAEHWHRKVDPTMDMPRLQTDHARALADAALLDDAEGMLTNALAVLRAQGQYTELPACLLRAAEIGVARGNLAGAMEAADEAARLFAQQGRDRWVALATNLALRARVRLDGASPATVAELDRACEQLDEYGWHAEALRTQLLVAMLHAESDTMAPRALLPGVREAVRRGRAVDRILLAYVDALTAVRRGDRAAARRSITNGLRVAVHAQAGMGAMETRAHAARYGYDLTELGARLAITDGRAMELLGRIEATRLMTSRMPMLRPPEDDAMAAMLTELRSLGVRIADVDTPTHERIEAENLRIRLERRVRRHARGARGDQTVVAGFETELREAVAMLGDRQLLAHASLDGRLYAVSISAGRARLHDLGDASPVGGLIDNLAFALHRLNRTQGSSSSRESAALLLHVVAAELAGLVVPAEIAEGDGPLVVVPTAMLHDVPWGVLPTLAGRTVSVNPSVTAWAKAAQASASRLSFHGGERAVGLVAGPGLAHAAAEVEALSKLYASAAALSGRDATVPRSLDLVAGSDVVHIACHGAFRADNPMFSSLELADGPLVVYDFERLSRLPEVVVLSACSLANSKVLQGGSVLGLAAALTTLGAASVIAPLTPISDSSSVEVMCRLHRAMATGATPAAALACASTAERSEQRAWTAGSFVALGA